MRGVHDQLFKDLAIAFPADMVRLVMPDLVAKIDLSRVAFASPEAFTDVPHGRRRYPDLVADAVGLSPSLEEALLHLEIEFRFRSAVRPRLSEYNSLLNLRGGRPVHTGALFARGGPPGPVREVYKEISFGDEIRRFRFHSLSLSRASAPTYLKRPERLAWAFAVFMRPGEIGSRAELTLACLRRIAADRGLDDARRFLLANFVMTYGVQSDPRVAREYEALLRDPRNKETQEMMMTWADRVKMEGREEGREEGRQGMQDLVLRQLKQRFGRVPATIRERIAKMDPPQLTEIAEKIFQAQSLRELVPE